MSITRDRCGVPHVTASSVTALAFEQGVATAQDRAWQLEHARVRAEGSAAAWLGPFQVGWDRLARRLGLDTLGRRAHAALDAEAARFVDAYVEGVNEGLASATDVPELVALGVAPGGWSPWTPLSVFLAQHVLFGSFPATLFRHHAERHAGREVADLLHHEGLWSSGSNSWVVGGERTASGLPMMGGDPHRSFESPNVYQQVRLTCTDPEDSFDVAGFTFPGVPGVQHFAHAGTVAWGITNAMADYQDVYLERVERRGDEVWAEGPSGWAPAARHVETIHVRDGADEAVEVVVTANGPVLTGSPGQECFSVRTASYALGEAGFGCLLPLLRARTTAEVLAALAGWVEPVNNLLVADVHGSVEQAVVGRVPARAEANRHRPVPGWDAAFSWTGWVDLPGRTVPPDGHLVTANHRMDATFDRIGTQFATPARADRIEALLAGRGALVGEDFAAIHRDALAGQPAPLREAVLALGGLSPAAAALREELAAWDQRMEADSRTAAAYVDVRDALVFRVAAAEPFARLTAPSPHGPLLELGFDVPRQLFLSIANLLSARGRSLVPDLDAHLAAAVEEVAAAPRRTWGSRHRYRPPHALGWQGPQEPGLAGDNDCVRCAGGVPGTDDAVRGAVARYVWDLAGLPTSGWVVPLGASGDPRSEHHHDQLAAYVAGTLHPVDAS